MEPSRHYRLRSRANYDQYEHSCKYSTGMFKDSPLTEVKVSLAMNPDSKTRFKFEPRLPTEKDEKLVSLIFEQHEALLYSTLSVQRIKSEVCVA